MAENIKVRKIIDDKGGMSVFARITLVLSIIQLIVGIGSYMSTTADTLLLVVFAMAALVVVALAAFVWDSLTAFRRTTRIILIALPSALLLLGLGCATYVSIAQPAADSAVNLAAATADTDIAYNYLFCLSVVVAYAQIILGFFTPTLVAAASFGRTIDRIVLNIMAVFQAIAMIFIVFCASPFYQIPLWNNDNYLPMWQVDPLGIEVSLMQIVMIVLHLVFAVMTFIPALGKTNVIKKAPN